MLSPARAVARSLAWTSNAPRSLACRSSAAVHGPSRQSLRHSSSSSNTKSTRKKKTDVPSAKRRWPKFDTPADASEIVYEPTTSSGGPITISWTDRFLYVQDSNAHGRRSLKPATLRDSCTCPLCKDAASGQKSYASTEIPIDIGIANVRATEQGLGITFAQDIERFATQGHEMMLPWSSVEVALRRRNVQDMSIPRKNSVLRRTGVTYWDRHILEKQVRRIDYDDFMRGGDAVWTAVVDICRLGIVYLKNVPQDEDAVVRITSRIASLRETFYGRTFDVRAKPNAENVAYTSGYLGLHQDLLYLDPPPMIQVLHCMENSCHGGESLFSDGERVGRLLWPFLESPKMAPLKDHFIPYQYDKNGYHYFGSRYVVDHNPGGFAGVFWSPPFQGKYLSAAKDLRSWIAPARIFEALVNEPDAVYEKKMEPGECVLFDNLRVMHGRKAFDAAGGSRWLRGAYIAGEDFLSKASLVPEGVAEAARGPTPWTPDAAQQALRATKWHSDVLDLVRGIDPEWTE